MSTNERVLSSRTVIKGSESLSSFTESLLLLLFASASIAWCFFIGKMACSIGMILVRL